MNKKKKTATISNVAQSQSSFSLLSLSLISPSSYNPRKKIDESELMELASSIKEKGVLQPIVVRPIGERFEVVCGERRYRASLLAENETIPAMVRELSDDEAFEFAITENLQRKDVSPMEEAAAFQMLIEQKKYDIASLAARFGKSESYIRARLRLMTLFPEIADLLNSDLITLNGALEISKYPVDIQEEIYCAHLKDEGWNSWRDLKVKDLAKKIENTYTTSIDRFHFDKTECFSCPYNSSSLNLFATENDCGNCSNKECLRSKTNNYMVDKAIEMLADDALVSLCTARWNYNEKVVEMLKEKGYEISDARNFISQPEEPEMPERVEDESDEEFEEVLKEYESEKEEYIKELDEWNKGLESGNYAKYVMIEDKEVTLCYAEKTKDINTQGITQNSFETEIQNLDKKDERNKEIAREKTISSVKDCLKKSTFTGEFSLNEEKAMYYFMLSKVSREQYELLGVNPDIYYLSDKDKMNIISNLTDDSKNIIRRAYLVAKFSNAFRYDETANFLMQFALQHFPEELSEIEVVNNTIYERRHQKIEEKKILLEAEAKKQDEIILEPKIDEVPNKDTDVSKQDEKIAEVVEMALVLVNKETVESVQQDEEIEELIAEEVFI